MTRMARTIRIPTFLVALTAGVLVVAGLRFLTGCAPVGDVKPPEPITPPEKIQSPAPPASLKERVKAALDQVKNRELRTSHSFWTVFHAILGNGLDAKIFDANTNKEYTALDYICNGGHIWGLQFFVHEKIMDGKDGVDVQIGPTFYGQGHQDQFVAEMTQLGLPLNTVFHIQYKDEKAKRQYTFEDFLRYSKANTRMEGNEELSWTVLAVAQYYGTQLSWTNKFGKKIDFEDLVRHEVDQPVETAACGGTHRLFGLTWAYYIHLRDGGKMTPVWQKLDAKLKIYRDKAHNDRNKDLGTFSTEYFKGPGRSSDIERKIGTTGHIVEWLALYLPDEELTQPWMQDAVEALALMILDSQDKLLDGGALYHAAHGLHLYYWRAWHADDAIPASKVIPLPPKK
jgi:hypothetical protein